MTLHSRSVGTCADRERGKIVVYSSSSLESDWSELENFGLELSFFPNWICESKLKHMGNFYSFILFIPSFFVKKIRKKKGSCMKHHHISKIFSVFLYFFSSRLLKMFAILKLSI